ncbi:tetratricopeptide repeat protein 12 [Cololabis saira]|uniref:tetratricopeptide repeat protein 12 n=1 Tax=Cololabis saira TaxID=129043 RepID=UPI002AD329D8|nr:tetratricopeptide repeat protein 12 [Cololabis saira]
MENLEDVEIFLKNVDKISQLVGDLQSSDGEVQKEAMLQADCYIAALPEACRTTLNKTGINTNPPLHPSLVKTYTTEHFMKIMEKDAEDRRIKRMTKVKHATALKDKGNEAYARGDYETAVKYYSDGLAEVKDMQTLYTNRAQAYIKLERYCEAISDCEWALKVNDGCIKAYFHMGKAYLRLRKHIEARNCFEKIMEMESGKENMVKEYLDLVDSEEKRELEEVKARKEHSKGEIKTTAVLQLLEKLLRPSETPLYYCGGLEILSQVVTDCTGQTLFRVNNGFSIISSNDTVRSCLMQKTQDADSQDLCVSVLKLWKVICCENDENQKMLMRCPVARESVVHLVTSEHAAVRKECLELLCLYSKTSRGRRLATENLNSHILLKNLMASMSEPKEQHASTAVSILETFAAEERFRIQLRDVLTNSLVVPFTTMLKNISKSNQHVLPTLISAVGCLAQDNVIHQNLAHEQQCWEAFLAAFKQCTASGYKEILIPLLGLIFNLSTITSPAIHEYSVSICDSCLGLLEDANEEIITRATGVLSNVLPQSSEAVHHVIQENVVQKMLWLLKGTGQTATKWAIKTMTVCTAAGDFARKQLLKSDKKLSTLRHLLSSSCDEMISGNAALCLAHCFELEGVATRLLGTDIVLLLLRHAAGDTERTAVQKNSAIALGKLCRSDPRHVQKLRELHGLEILHSCAKFIS